MSDPFAEPGPPDEAMRAIALLTLQGATVGVAESVTGGLVTGALTSVPGASAVVRGCVVAYALDVKAALLGVDQALLDRVGAVDREVAVQMALGARRLLGATYGLATTGEAGPDSASGQPVGTVHVALSGPDGPLSERLHAEGDRSAVRSAAVDAALRLLLRAVLDAAAG